MASLEYQLKEIKRKIKDRDVLKKVQIKYLSGPFGPVVDKDGKVLKEGQFDIVREDKAQRLVKAGKAEIVKEKGGK